MPPPGHAVPVAPLPPGRALCSAPERRPRSRNSSSPRRKGTSLGGGNGAAWPRTGWRGPRGGLSAPRSQPGFLSQREAFVHRHPSDCPFSVPVSFLTRPQPGLLLWLQGAGGSMGRFHSPPFQSPRTSQPCLATCLGGGDSGPCSRHSAPIPGSSSTPAPSPGVCAVTFTSMHVVPGVVWQSHPWVVGVGREGPT